jgi:hypothetical protein
MILRPLIAMLSAAFSFDKICQTSQLADCNSNRSGIMILQGAEI